MKLRMIPRFLPMGLALLLSACVQPGIVLDADETVIAASIHPTASGVAWTSPKNVRGEKREILILTSGGADGAFGAGVLQAWSASGGRPAFDVVAGVSSGALQATWAFLGSDKDALLEQLYTTTRTRDLFRPNGLRSIGGSGLYDPAPMRRLLTKHITEEILDDVAAAHRSGRRLYVGTTDLTLGTTVYWDMGAIASGGGKRRSDYVDILIASGAAPGLIEPVRIVDGKRKTGSFHGDGGVKSPVPLETFMLGAGNGSRCRVWVIANGHVSRNSLRSDAATSLALARRGIAQLLRQLLYSSVRDAEWKTARAGGQFRLIALPETVAEADDPFEFEPAEMKRLFAAGNEVGRERFGKPGW
jgi:predicted acylesterase/phospholipase RssA